MKLNETSATARRIGPIRCVDAAGTPVTVGFGTAGAVEVSVNDNGTALNTHFAYGTAQSAPTPAPQAEPAPRNFVCERVSIANPQAKCTAELSGVGDLSTHTARVEIGKDTLACAINSQQVAVVCGPLFVVPQPAPQPAPPKAEKK